ncbi:unnamed protein product, partial [Notodromas monacha]
MAVVSTASAAESFPVRKNSTAINLDDTIESEDVNGSPKVKLEAADSNVSSGTLRASGGAAGAAAKKTDKEKKIGHRRVDEEGQITYKKIQTSQIMSSIQLGIAHAVGSLASKPERNLLMQDFAVVETVYFAKEGSQHTPAHHNQDFHFKIYAPMAFRYFRDLFGIQPDDFLASYIRSSGRSFHVLVPEDESLKKNFSLLFIRRVSMCDSPLKELSNAGASGSIFYLTIDDEFIVKTVQHKEAEFLQKLLPGYYMNLNQNPRTLLPKFFGLYCYQVGIISNESKSIVFKDAFFLVQCNSKNVRLIVMNNLLPSSISYHQKYDLKGSTYKRKANKYERNKKSPTFKDLDFIEHHTEGLMLEAETYCALMKTIQRDCRLPQQYCYPNLLTVQNQKNNAAIISFATYPIPGAASKDCSIGNEPKSMGSTILIVNYLPVELSREGLRRMFLPFGAFVRCRIILQHCRWDGDQRVLGGSVGYGFVNLAFSSDAQRAVCVLNGSKLLGKTLKRTTTTSRECSGTNADKNRETHRVKEPRSALLTEETIHTHMFQNEDSDASIAGLETQANTKA